MPELPAGTDRNRLVVVRPKDAPKPADGEQPVEHVVGAAWLQSPQGADDYEFLRFDGETQDQADAREAAAVEATKPVKAGDGSGRRAPNFD